MLCPHADVQAATTLQVADTRFHCRSHSMPPHVQGRTVNFANTLLILTSNLGSEFLTAAGPTAQDRKQAEDLALGAVHSHFRPEVRLIPADSSGVLHVAFGLWFSEHMCRFSEIGCVHAFRCHAWCFWSSSLYWHLLHLARSNSLTDFSIF
jgi:hypothetical protein